MKLRYADFVERIDLDAFENAIGFVPMSQNNNEDTGQCPDVWGLHKHGDTTGKFSINRDKHVYNCWVCGGGSLLSLSMSITGYDPGEATRWLYQFVNEEEEQGNELEDQIQHILSGSSPIPTQAMPYFNEKVLARFENTYDPWCAERGITPEAQKSFGIRFSRSHEKRNKQGEIYSGRAIIIPHYWESGTSPGANRLVGWQERWLDERPKWLGKYTNTPGFPKEETLFNYWSCVTDLELPPIVIVESVVTVMFLESANIPAIATFGSNVNGPQMELITLFSQGVVLCADNDKPGLKWRNQLTEYLEDFIPVWWTELVGEPDSGNDLGDLAPDHNAAQKMIDSKVLPLEAELNRTFNI